MQAARTSKSYIPRCYNTIIVHKPSDIKAGSGNRTGSYTVMVLSRVIIGLLVLNNNFE